MGKDEFQEHVPYDGSLAGRNSSVDSGDGEGEELAVRGAAGDGASAPEDDV